MGTAYRYLGLVKMAQGKLEEAKSLLLTSIETFGDYFTGWDIAKSWMLLAEAVLRSCERDEAKRACLEALRLSRDAEAVPLMLDALRGLADIRLQAGRHREAFEVSTFVLRHEASTQQTKDHAQQLQARAEPGLDSEQIRLSRTRIAGETLETLVHMFI